ncbi:hypothetical protein Ait01nite_032400 [Actinoplanes italicus]|uniref:Uncharacterized protein n=1 Tax=Actinoplanes italicus TaxID=113567 RepID=A0A2T0KJJ5_9ACTN|nr:ABC transporter permease [Actinoplanes italicus]PRX23693.1 hypothetical protein CLV67_103442 [Actinoplanes italicus]GIE30195.1 hypothetical protein Ait01nite_032400 [Actinoplanes italicus]
MTITATPPRRTREQLLTEARQHVGSGSIPSIETLRATLRVRRETAADVCRTLSQERAQRRAERARQGRAALAALARRKRPRPRPAVVIASVPEIAPAPAAELAAPAPVEVTGIVRDKAVAPVAKAAQTPPRPAKPLRTWPVLILCLPAFVAIWGGWVDLGGMTGFGVVHPFPGIPRLEDFTINTAITLPFGMETYAAYALHVWLSGRAHGKALRFARNSAVGSLLLGFSGQSLYHLMAAAGWTVAPWPITLLVSGIPVAVLGMGAALAHLVRSDAHQ